MRPQSIVHMFQDACNQFNKSAAVMVKIDGTYKSFSHKFFKQRVNHFGRGLLHLGLAAGEHVAILSETRFEWAIADLGILSAGGVVVPVYQTLLADQVAYILNNSESVGVVCSNRDQAQKVLEIKDDCPHLRFVLVMEEGSEPLEGVVDMPALETQGSRQDNEHILEERTEALKADDLLTIIYTSGTTGNPKGVMLSHDNLISNIKSIEPYMPFTEKDTCLSHLPLSHVFERMSGYYAMIYRGVTIAYAEDIKTVPQNLLEVKPSVLVSVPRLFEKIYAKIMANVETSSFVKRKIFSWAMKTGRKALPYFNNNRPLTGVLASKWNMADKMVFAKIREKTGGNLKFMFSGGAPLAREIAEMFLGMGMTMIEGYGLTETSPVLTVNRPDKNKPGTVGPAVPDVEVRIADDGEILARGPNIMKGYYKNPEATADAIVDDWFHTGDIGVLDEDGYLRITDRKKDLIVTSGGKNIAPQPMENALKLSPLIEQAIVIGEKRNFISALIIPPWETVAEWAPLKGWSSDPLELASDPAFYSAVMADVNKQLQGFAHYEKVKKITILPSMLTVETGELTPSLKVKRRVVNEKFAGLIDAMYE